MVDRHYPGCLQGTNQAQQVYQVRFTRRDLEITAEASTLTSSPLRTLRLLRVSVLRRVKLIMAVFDSRNVMDLVVIGDARGSLGRMTDVTGLGQGPGQSD